MWKENLTPLNVWQELTHSYLLSSVCIIMLWFQKSMIMECSLFTIRLIRTLNLPPGNHLTWLKKVQPSFISKDRLIGTKLQTICIPVSSTITILGHTNKLPPRITCLVEQVEHNNLPLGTVINWCMAILKARTIPMIIINTNRYNVWLRQPLLAAKLYDIKCIEIEYRATMDWEGDTITIGFQPIPPQLMNTNRCQVEKGPIQPTSPKMEKPEFGPRPDTNSTDFDFKTEIDWLSFQLNIGKETSLMWDQQSHFINLVYDNKEVFSLHSEDMGYYSLIKHTIPMYN